METRWIKLKSVSSTNSHISTLLSQGKISEPLVVIADYQEAGRGQGKHSWQSERGKNLLMSILLFPAFLSAPRQFHLSRLASLAICDTLELLGINPMIKWPNDILTLNGKIAGILIEHGIYGSRILRTTIGIGLNLNQRIFPEFPIAATSVNLENGMSLVPLEVAEMLVKNLQTRYDKLAQGESDTLERDYGANLYRMNQPSAFQSGNETFQGVIRGVNDYGELQVEKDGELMTFSHGEVIVLSTQW